jgi:hypothetical protein
LAAWSDSCWADQRVESWAGMRAVRSVAVMVAQWVGSTAAA